MKHGFLTPYDSPQFAKGVLTLVAELKRSAKTLDGKYDYSIPFKLLDKDNCQSIRLCEFETAMRELGLGQYLNDQEIKSVVRRFHVDDGGGIDFEEFCRFLTTPTDHGDHANVGALNHPKVVAAITEAFVQLPPYGVLSFANMIKRMCSMADKDGSGSVTATKFAQVFDTLDIALPRASKTDHHPLLIQLLCDKDENVPYGVFCDLYVAAMSPPPAPTKQSEVDKESHKVLTEAFTEMQKMMVQKGVEFDYKSAFSLIDKGVITPPDLNEVLWAAGVRYPFSPEELTVLHRAFLKETGSFDADKFCDFAVRGPVVCAKVADEANSKVDAVIAHLQASIKQLVSNDKDATKFHKLFLDFDGNNDGTISTTEFLHILDHMGLSKGLTPAETDAILHFFDVNGDHAIDYTEFFHFANHADVMLQANVNASKGTVAVNASPPKTTAGSAPSSPLKTTGSAPPSPSKSVTSTSKSPSKDNILALQHPNG
ncbi:hypothetical protein DYB37_002122 [Aphanomyces astaci]|uniref:EF-hand domain-containing protein n=1 Tax=Aphanomyces astaci TaxID=112090 RepID=A0A3R7B9V8_APHAT|nr:hypothetical protein DYB35_001974 [Aphanomyces astaci]RHZ22667.1 hypothetical protein DYB37_002122 [Aphanomyces astaci]